MIKKIYLFFVLLLFLVFFQSCGFDSYSKNKITLDVMGYGNEENSEGTTFLRIVSEYEKLHPEVTVKYSLLHDAEYHQKVESRIIAGNIPDIAYMGSDARWGKSWNEAGLQIDMKPYLDEKKYDYNSISFDNDKEEILYIPMGTANLCTVLFVNEKLLKQLGLSMPQTYDDLKAMVPVAKKAGVQIIGTHGADSWVWGSCFLSTFIARTSGDATWIEKALSGEVSFTDVEFINALDIFSKMVQDGILSKESVLIDADTGIKNYNKGKYLIYVSGQWDAANINPELQENTRLMAFPDLPNEKGCAKTIAATKQAGYGVTRFALADDAKITAAMDFLNFYYSEKETLLRLKKGEIVAPILKDFVIPDDISSIAKEKAALGMKVGITDVIDSFLTGNPNTALCEGVQSLITENINSKQLASEIESMVR